MRKLLDQWPTLARQELRWMMQAIIDRRTGGGIRNDAHLNSAIETFTDKEKIRLNAWIRDRVLGHKPLQYILRSQPFCGLDIKVRPPTLIPRWETEELTCSVIDLLQNYITQYSPQEIRILDLCSGSGCISIAIAHRLSRMPVKLQVIGIDNSPSAITLARINQRKLLTTENLEFIHADIFKELPISGSFDLIISNPPYISLDQKNKLDRDVLDWEDHSALFAEDDGLIFYKRIIDLAPQILKRNSFSSIVLEIDGDDQSQSIVNYGEHTFDCQIRKDMMGSTRYIYCKYRL